jgi:hypothetical protein
MEKQATVVNLSLRFITVSGSDALMTGDETELLLPPPTEVGKEEVQGAFRDGTCYPPEQVQSQTTLSDQNLAHIR